MKAILYFEAIRAGFIECDYAQPKWSPYTQRMIPNSLKKIHWVTKFLKVIF